MILQKQTSKEYFRSLKIIFFALLIGQATFGLLAIFLISEIGPLVSDGDTTLRDIFIYIVPLVALNTFVTGNLLYKNRLKKVRGNRELITKMTDYKAAMIVRLALLEGASFFSIVTYLLTADYLFMAIVIFLQIYFITLKPVLEKIVLDLELSQAEVLQLEDPNEIIAEFKS